MKQIFCRVPAPLKVYLPNLDIGLRMILTQWRMPPIEVSNRVRCHARIPDEWHRQIGEIAQQTGQTRNVVVIAALQIAARSSFNPRPEVPRDSPLNRGRPRQWSRASDLT